MPKVCRNYIGQVIILCSIFLLSFFVSRPIIVFADSSNAGLVRSGSFTIEEKGDKFVIVGERHFIVKKSTIIRGSNGKTVQMDDISIPCKAEVEYLLIMDKDPVILKMKIK